MPWVRPSTNFLPASCATCRRLGDTSVASIDSDTSITSTTVARLRGTFCTEVGPAAAMVSSTKPTSISAIGAWRIGFGRAGATFSSTDMLENRSICLCLLRCTST